MFSIFLALALFIIQIPIKTALLALRASVAVGKIGINNIQKSLDDSPEGSLKQRLNKTGKNVRKGTDTAVKTIKTASKATKTTTKLTLKAVKLLIHTLKLILLVIKALVTFLLSLGAIGIIILFLLILILAGAVAASIVLISSEDDFGSSISSNGSGTVISDSSGTNVGDWSGTVDTSSLESCCRTMGEWYISNVATYGTKTFSCPLVNNKAVRADCTGFAAAYASLVSGEDVATSSSEAMINSWDATNHGWVKLNITESTQLTDLKTGDILVTYTGRNKGQEHHAEIFLSPGTKFGWGSVQDVFPKSCIWSKNGAFISDGYHTHYSVIYRYNGN